MNPFLAELYNTADNIGISKTASDDTEKLAQAAILDQMLQNEGLKVENLSSSDIIKVATEIFGPNSPLVKSAEEEMPMPSSAHEASETPEEEAVEEKALEEVKEETKEEAKEEEEEKLASDMRKADFLGRQMAHAYVDELTKLEKSASKQKVAHKQKTASKSNSVGQVSALDQLALARAEEMLKQAGITKEPTPEQRLEHAIQTRAVEMLKEAGYKVG